MFYHEEEEPPFLMKILKNFFRLNINLFDTLRNLITDIYILRKKVFRDCKQKEKAYYRRKPFYIKPISKLFAVNVKITAITLSHFI